MQPLIPPPLPPGKQSASLLPTALESTVSWSQQCGPPAAAAAAGVPPSGTAGLTHNTEVKQQKKTKPCFEVCRRPQALHPSATLTGGHRDPVRGSRLRPPADCRTPDSGWPDVFCRPVLTAGTHNLLVSAPDTDRHFPDRERNSVLSLQWRRSQVVDRAQKHKHTRG